MRRTTISLPEDLSHAVEREARRRRVPVSQVIRESVEAQLGMGEPRRIGFAAIGRSGQHDTARRVDEILDAEWTRAGYR